MKDKILEWLRRKRIGVLYGGFSEEREISRRTGRAVMNALRELKLNAVGVEVDESLPQKLISQKINYCFIALHGKWGEDGTVQGLCEMMKIPYSGSGVLASALSMNKAVSKKMFQYAKIPTPPFTTLDSRLRGNDAFNKNNFILPFGLPAVVKPVDGGSAIGVSIVKNKLQLNQAVRSALRYSQTALIEKFIPGKEITAPVLGTRVLPLIEIVPKNSFYDYRAKYVKGMSEHILPARISKKTEEEIRKLALRVHVVLGCRAFSRIDFIVDRRGRPWVLELNSIPGMTETSLFPEAARATGLSFPKMLLEIIGAGIFRK